MEASPFDPISEVSQLREEVATLNHLLEDSALTLQALNAKYQTERETNEKLVEYVSVYERTIQHMESENEALRRKLLEMERATLAQAENHTSDNVKLHDPTKVSIGSPFSNVIAEVLRACEHTTRQQEKITQSMRGLAEELVESMATEDVDMELLLQRFPSVAFERREPEPDPHKSTKGWVARSPKRVATQSGAHSSTVGVGAFSSPEKKPAEADFAFGSPSERFPLFEAQALDEREVDADNEEVL